MYTRIVRRTHLRILHTAQEPLRKAITSSNKTHAHIFCVHLCNLFLQKRVKEIQQKIDLALWPLPVLRRECVDRQHLDAHIRCCSHNALERTRSRLMPCRARAPLRLRPASVAVHNNGDMPRQSCMVNCKIGRKMIPIGNRRTLPAAEYLSPHIDPFPFPYGISILPKYPSSKCRKGLYPLSEVLLHRRQRRYSAPVPESV